MSFNPDNPKHVEIVRRAMDGESTKRIAQAMIMGATSIRTILSFARQAVPGVPTAAQRQRMRAERIKRQAAGQGHSSVSSERRRRAHPARNAAYSGCLPARHEARGSRQAGRHGSRLSGARGMKHEEDGLHAFVADALRLYKAPGVVWFHPPNQGPRSPRYAARLKRMGVLAGVADIVVVIEGRAHFLELKAAKGRLSPAQKAFREASMAASAPYAVASTPEQACNVLLGWGALSGDPLGRLSDLMDEMSQRRVA
jgi:hypothetical protein